MSIIRRSRRAKAIQNARFGFMFITAQYAPEMKSDQLCLFDIFVYFGSATQKLCHIFRLFRLRFQLKVLGYSVFVHRFITLRNEDTFRNVALR